MPLGLISRCYHRGGQTRDVEALVIDVKDLEAEEGRGGIGGDAGLEVGEELGGAIGFCLRVRRL